MCPSGTGQQAEFVDGMFLVKWKLRHSNCDSTLYSHRVLFPTIRQGLDNQGGSDVGGMNGL